MRKRAKKRDTAQHRAWQFMRRNRVFRVGDVMVVTEISVGNFRRFLKCLRDGGYIEAMNSERGLIDKRYRLIRDTGVYAPTITNNILWDVNLEVSDEHKSAS